MSKLLPVILVLLISACASAGDVALKSVESVARAACQAAGNCSNTCPDGTAARPPNWGCPSRP